MSADKLVFDLSSEIEGSPNVFVRKDWINILDNQNQNYNSNQSVLDTSQLSNSNKYMSYREAYFSMPLLLTLAQTAPSVGFTPATAATTADYSFGLKSWFGQIIHSFTLDYNGTTIIQQTPYVNMWNSFKLMTSFSYNDVITQGSTIGFYPDDALSWSFTPFGTANKAGQGVCNNATSTLATGNPITTGGSFNSYSSGIVNNGYVKRMSYVNYDTDSVIGGGSTYANLFPVQSCKNMWKSFVSAKVDGTVAVSGYIQISVQATIYLKHIHSFFAMCPLIKGAFLKMTANLNNTTTSIAVGVDATPALNSLSVVSVSNPVGGCNPLMFSSANTITISGFAYPSANVNALADEAQTLIMNVSVGGKCLGSGFPAISTGQVSQSVYLYIPAYTFNPVFEQAYLSSPIKSIKYTDIYQYQVLNVASSGQFNNLLTNGIANIKSVLILPFLSTSGGLPHNNGLPAGIPVYQSPFDTAGTGTTSPLALLGNFNVVVSGQNAIYNQQRYAFEQFNNQLYGQNAVNGGMTDGLTSGLINSQMFESLYCYYYVNVSRMLPVEESVPKSIQIIGTNYSELALDLYCFVEYGVSVDIDILTGARV